MAKNITELCFLLVEDFYGDLSAQVFTTLAQWGRISLRTLIQNSDLSAKQVYHGLTVLIQQHLILHHTPAASPSYYEVDWEGAYNLVRSGKIISLVESRLGTKAAHVLSSLLQLGHAKVSDLEGAFKFGKTKAAVEVLANGNDRILSADDSNVHSSEHSRVTSKEELHNVLYQLIQARFVAKVHHRSYLSPTDKQNEIEELVKDEEFPGGKTSGPKARMAFESSVLIKKRKWRDEEEDVSQFVQHKNKRAKTNGHMVNGNGRHILASASEEVTLGPDLVLRVNFDRCATAMRSDKLAQHAQRYLGEATARVYEALLHVIEKQIVSCKPMQGTKIADVEDLDGTLDVCKATTMDVLEYLEDDPDALELLGLDPGGANGTHEREPRSKKPKLDEGHSSIKSRNNTLHEVETHLRLLTEHELSFVEHISTRGRGEYAVPFNSLTQALRDFETETIICARFGTVAARMVRLLKQKGKLDEKQICSLALLRVKDVRCVLDNLLEAGLVESQEIPKDATRQPSRALYLWYFDQHRAEQLVLDTSFTAMARCLQRVRVQRAAVQGVIDKAERTDVVGHEDEFLTKADKLHLRTWREQEEKLLAQVARIDDGVALLRDF